MGMGNAALTGPEEGDMGYHKVWCDADFCYICEMGKEVGGMRNVLENVVGNMRNVLENVLEMLQAVVVLISAVAVLCGCCGAGQNVEDGVIQINEEDIIALDRSFEGMMVETWEPVFLEDSEDGLIADIRGEIRYDDGLFFVCSDQRNTSAIKVFDENGHYLRDISHQGRARYEFLNLYQWTLDPVHNEVLIFEYGTGFTIKYYDYSGNYLRTADFGDEYGPWGFGSEPVCLSDGTVMLHNIMRLFPSPEYVMLHPDGTVNTLFEVTEDKIVGEESRYYGGVLISWKCYDPCGDEVWLTRFYDNHLYKLVGSDSVQCMADITFIDEVPEKIRHALDIENRGIVESISKSILNECRNFKDYFSFQYLERPPMLFDKTTSRTYQFNENDSTAYLPEYYEFENSSVHDNDWIVFLTPELVEDQNTFIHSPEYDGRYSDEIKKFYQEASKTDNPVLLVLHLRSPEEEWVMPHRFQISKD